MTARFVVRLSPRLMLVSDKALLLPPLCSRHCPIENGEWRVASNAPNGQIPVGTDVSELDASAIYNATLAT